MDIYDNCSSCEEPIVIDAEFECEICGNPFHEKCSFDTSTSGY